MSRLDLSVVQCGLAPSRQRAKLLIQNGQILVNGIVCTKPAYTVIETDQVTMQGDDIPFVGRGGLKLEHALRQTGLDLAGLICMDIGASTGGFTDCMLQHGALKVYAVDVGHDQLAVSLRCDPRVVNLEGTDIRQMIPTQMGEEISFISIDVSFISLRLVLPAAASFLKPDGQAVILIKPQFEAGREHIGKNGLVLSQKVHRQVLAQVVQLLAELQFSLRMLCPSPIQGGSGNVEYLAVVQKAEEGTVTPDIAELVSQAFLEAKKEKAK